MRLIKKKKNRRDAFTFMVKIFKNKIIILFDGNYTEVTVYNNYNNAIVMIFLAIIITNLIIMILGCVTIPMRAR